MGRITQLVFPGLISHQRQIPVSSISSKHISFPNTVSLMVMGMPTIVHFDLPADDTEKVKKLGGKIIMLKMPVPGWGYLAACVDTENNTFGLWEEDSSAK